MLGASLGIERDDVEALAAIERDDVEAFAAIERGYGVAVRVDAPGITLSDYHTAQVPPA